MAFGTSSHLIRKNASLKRMFGICLFAMAWLLGVSAASAQAPAEEIHTRVKEGQKLVVVNFEDSALPAQSTNNWTAVTTLQSGKKVSIELKSGKKVKGKFGSASETSITVIRGKNTEDVNRADIQKVYRENGKSIGESTLIGTGMGGGVGAIMGAAVGGCNGDQWVCFTRGETATYLGAFGAGLGAITGFLVGSLSHNMTLIYEAT